MKKRLVTILVLLLLIILFSSLYFVVTNKQEKNIEVKPDPNHHQKIEIKVPEEPVETLNITSNINVSENKDLEEFFKTFFDSYYKSLADLELTDTTYMFSNSENAKIFDMQTNYLNNNYTKLTCDHAYDRESAYNYATQWVGKRNSRWARFDANCVNYVSQVMYNGGIPMDYYGDYQWKFYDLNKNDNNTASGFTYSWTWVPALSNYFKYNKGYGLCGKYNENLYLGEKGDVVVVGSKGADRHVVTIIDQVKEDGKVIDLLVNSNTVDLENFPLSAYAYPYKVLLKVYGWNEK